MRALLAEYISFEIDILMKDLAFRDLMIQDEILDTAQRQSLLDDYMAAVMKRIWLAGAMFLGLIKGQGGPPVHQSDWS